MASAKSQAILRKQREAKQKKLLFLLIPVLLIAVVIQGPRLLKMLNGSGEEPAQSQAAETGAAETGAAGEAGGATPSDPAAAGTTPPAAGVGPVAVAELVNSDVPAEPGEGQLVSFARFVGKDPFKQLAEPAPAGEDQGQEAPTKSGGESDKPASGGTTPVDGGDGDEPETPNAAKLTVNGIAQTVLVDGSFPETDPAFKVAEVTKDGIEIGLVTGSFSTGVDTIELEIGETLTLVSQPDGIRYVIKLLGVSAEDDPNR